MQWARITAAFAFGLSVAPLPASAADLEQLKQEYAEAKRLADEGQREFAGVNISNNSRSEAGLEKEWDIAARWIVESLDVQGNIGNLSTTAQKLDRSFYADATLLEPNLYLIGIGNGEMGSFFIVREMDRRFDVVWNVRQLSKDDFARVPLEFAWTTSGARDDCRSKKADEAWDQCGGIGPGQVGILPKDSVGRTRFYLDAGYAAFAGSTIGYQLSVWTWDGHRAIPQFAKSYAEMIENIGVPKLAGDTVRVRIKDEFENFPSCGACVGRQAIWSIRVTPTGVQDLGKKSLMPEIDTIDDLVGRMAHDESTADLAAPAVVGALAPLVASEKDESHKIDPKWFSLDMIENGEAEANPTNPAERLVCFSTDADGDRRIFTLEHRGNGFYISKMRDVGEGDTPDKLCTKPNE